MVAALDLGSSGESRGGSSPFIRTKPVENILQAFVFLVSPGRLSFKKKFWVFSVCLNFPIKNTISSFYVFFRSFSPFSRVSSFIALRMVSALQVRSVALENAASIAGMFLTTECVIVEKKEDKPE